MKILPLLVAGSLAANAALVTVYLSRPHGSAAEKTASTIGTAHSAADASATHGETPTVANAATGGKAWDKLNTGDLRALVERLRAAGFPPSVVRAVVNSQVNELFKARRAALRPQQEEKPFWVAEGNPFSMGYDAKYYAAMRDLSREQSKMVKDIVGEDTSENAATANQRRRFGDLPRDKTDQLSRIEQDYNDLRNELSLSSRGIILAEDRQKMALLEQEKRADLAQILGPQELEDYLMRTSRTTNQLRQTLGLMNATEAEFRAIYAAQSPFDEKYNNGMGGAFSGDAAREREEAQKQVYDQIKSALGNQRYAEYLRASDREFQQLARLTQQSNLSNETALQAYNLRSNASQESNRIAGDPGLSPDQKRAALQTLAQNTRAQISQTLGPEVSTGYLKVADRWLAAFDRGMAVTFSETGLPRMRPVGPLNRPQQPNAPAAPTPAR